MPSSSFGGGGWTMGLVGFGSVLDMVQDLRAGFDGSAAYVVGPTVEYAIYQELGTSSQPARPFMRPAVQRVQGSLSSEIRRVAASQGISLDGEEPIVRSAALAVEDHAKRIANAKNIRDTGALINSIEARRVS